MARALTVTTGVVINVHHLGATVRLEDGRLATVSAAELAANRVAYAAGLADRMPLRLVLERGGRHATVALERSFGTEVPAAAPAPEPEPPVPSADEHFEVQMNAFLKSTQEWAPPDRPEPAERHFIRKKRRAAFFEARKPGT